MSRRDFIIALFVVIVWGANFTIIKLGLQGVPSMLLASLRYIVTVFPAILFIKKPDIEWRYLIAYGLTVGVGQFSCLFYALEIGMPAGVASVVLQSQVFFTLIFAAIFLNERLKRVQLIGLIISAIGLYIIGEEANSNHLAAIPLQALVLTLLAAASFGLSNIVVSYAAKRTASRGSKLDMLSLVVWSSLAPPIPLLMLAFVFDTPQELWQSVSHLSFKSVLAILYLALCATIFGFGAWSRLLAKNHASKVAPLSMLVPVFGLITAHVVLNERLSMMQWIGGLVILFGLVAFNFGESTLKLMHKDTSSSK